VQLTAHFRRAEFGCPHCGVALVRPKLLEKLEKLRRLTGRPIVIVSGYRCPVHNKQVQGAADSQHMYGAAADLRPGTCSEHQAAAVGFTGIGTLNGSPTHVDVRDGELVTWTY
jgi:zinc D-Ala-D-Ala carboxypeptidase